MGTTKTVEAQCIGLKYRANVAADLFNRIDKAMDDDGSIDYDVLNTLFRIEPEPDNEYDVNAIRFIMDEDTTIGYIARDKTKEMHRYLDLYSDCYVTLFLIGIGLNKDGTKLLSLDFSILFESAN